LPEPSDTDWAYAAGFVDGEGCIAVSRSFIPARNKYGYSVQVVVANRDRPVLEWMQESWGGLVVSVSNRTGLARQSWIWRLQNRSKR
jgi:hypothetical protein